MAAATTTFTSSANLGIYVIGATAVTDADVTNITNALNVLLWQNGVDAITVIVDGSQWDADAINDVVAEIIAAAAGLTVTKLDDLADVDVA